MKIGFDARMICHSGIGVYIRSLLEELVPLAQEHSIFIFGPKREIEVLGSKYGNVKIFNCEVPIYSLQEQLFHPALKEKLDVLHVPHYNIPLAYRGAMVITLHDLNHLKMPEMLPNRLAYYYARFMINKARHRAKQIICISKATMKEADDFLGINGNSSNVIHLSVRPEFFERVLKSDLEIIRTRYQLPSNYILSVGILKPNKNLVTLIHAIRELRKEGMSDQHLVVVGKRFNQHPEILAELRRGEEEGLVQHLENVPLQDLRAIYQMATVFAFLSLSEGFGLPVLEAFASQVPVLASNVSSIPEVAGNGALLVDPKNHDEIKQALNRLLSDSSLRTQLIQKGIAELPRFSWRKTAQETLHVYNKAFGDVN